MVLAAWHPDYSVLQCTCQSLYGAKEIVISQYLSRITAITDAGQNSCYRTGSLKFLLYSG